MNAVLDAFRRAQFSMTDFLRQAQGDAVGAFGLDPTEAPYRIVASGTHWCLRDYGGEHGSRSLLIIAAPLGEESKRTTALVTEAGLFHRDHP